MSAPDALYLLDTDTLIHFLRGDRGVADSLRLAGERAVATSTINLAELYYGAFHSAHPHDNLNTVDRLRRRLRILPFDARVAVVFGRVKADLRADGHAPSDSDVMIAACALATRRVLVTNNVRHFRHVDGLTVDNWVKPSRRAGRS